MIEKKKTTAGDAAAPESPKAVKAGDQVRAHFQESPGPVRVHVAALVTKVQAGLCSVRVERPGRPAVELADLPHAAEARAGEPCWD